MGSHGREEVKKEEQFCRSINVRFLCILYLVNLVSTSVDPGHVSIYTQSDLEITFIWPYFSLNLALYDFECAYYQLGHPALPFILVDMHFRDR